MDHLIGQRFNLISKSEIRYVGTLHEINAEQSTIALENVYSFGTEDRSVAKFIPPSQDKYGFIVFRGGDVKDIKIAEDEPSQPSPPSMPNDPAILNASRPGPPPQGPPHDGPFSPPGFPPPPHFGGYYPPGQFGRGYGPPPAGFGPSPGFPPYGPPPPGYFGGPPGQGFQQGPPGFHPQPPIGPPGHRLNQSGPPPPSQQHPESSAPGPGLSPASAQTSELPVDNKAPDTTNTSASVREAPLDASTQIKPAQQEKAVKAGITSAVSATAHKTAPNGPKTTRVAPAVPFTVNQKSFTPPVPSAGDAPSSSNGAAASKPTKPAASQASMDEAARQAKEAVAAAMAKLNPQAPTAQAKSTPSAAPIDALTQRVNAMSTAPSATNGTHRGGRGTSRASRAGGGSYGRGGQKRMEIPKSDFDFESSNAKFNKEDLIKEAIASGSPPVAGSDELPVEGVAGKEASNSAPKRKDSLPLTTGSGYNKSSSFFDNISSEAKDREVAVDARAQGRQLRGEEFKKNIETFGQGNVDGGYRGGRGRGSGYGRGRNYSGGGYRGGYNNRGASANNSHRGNRGRAGQGQGDAAQPSQTVGQS
ncbi:uncharacterized protein A1O9_09082 [Exophiala aquamarina CBS 119918]|uniref:DFDF domain-containing protein n=1 Tax=Exophiala aquamarina CBS 119918 TaxID=1182545 RepID=A0A072PGF9_9EURO|nr:uncharacterized protein A1O9_09082 [Exophiala aquamarina CBS 119918]KEF54640.1 hypothetical protein A1O9_09082 [Exophiala aquamarina CBS 119918]